MRSRNLFIALFLWFSAASLYGNEAEEIRKSIPQLKGERQVEAYERLYWLSLDDDDQDYQLKCINDLITVCQQQGNRERECGSRAMKIVLFYNNELDDSLYEQVPATLDFLRTNKSWRNYYEVWSLLVNTYSFTAQNNEGLKSVNAMFNDAVERQDKYGMGLAYYAMGNVYANMYNSDEAASSYQKSIDLLMQTKPLPMQLSDIFAYYGDVLENKQDYQGLDRLTSQWKQFLTSYFEDNPDHEGEAQNRWAYYYLACVQAALGQDRLDKAESDLREVKERTVGEGTLLYKMWLYYCANLYLKQGRYKEALDLNDERVRLMMDSDDKSVLIRIREQRARILEHLGRYEEAAQLYHEMYTINDSINTHDIKHQLTEMHTRFHVEELEMEKVQAQYRYIIAIASIIVLALVVFILFRYRAAKRLKSAHAKLEDAHGQLLKAYDQLEETTTAKERIESELRIARDIQKGMVPQVFPPFPERDDIDLFASMIPAKAVGGDLFDFALMGEKLYFCLGDVSGKGVPASLFMAVAVNLFRVAVNQQLPPAEIATQLNNVLSEKNEKGMFVTMFIGVADLQTGHLDFCNAGHNPAIVKDLDGNARFIEMDPNAPLGLWPGLDYVGESIDDISMQPFFIYSDGLNEAENVEQEQFGDDHLLELWQDLTYESAEQTVRMLNEAVEKHANGAEQSDDLTMLCLRVAGNRRIQVKS